MLYKYWAILLLPILFNHTPKNEIDDFKKFSYLLIVINGNDTVGNGTGFFVEKCNRIFLVSNFHILANKTFDTFQPIVRNNKVYKWDKILIRYRKKTEQQWHFYTLYLSDVWKSIRDSQIRKLPVDVWAQEIKDLDKKQLNIINIENDAIKDSKISIGCSSFVFGYPSSDYHKEKNYNKRDARLIEGSLSSYGNGKKVTAENETFSLSVPGKEGFSGAPVFCYYRSSNKNIFKFVGINFASVGENLNNLHAIGFRSDIIKGFLPVCNVNK